MGCRSADRRGADTAVIIERPGMEGILPFEMADIKLFGIGVEPAFLLVLQLEHTGWRVIIGSSAGDVKGTDQFPVSTASLEYITLLGV